MRVRTATPADTRTLAEIMAVVAEEGTLATEPPVDVDERARRFAAKLEDDSPGTSWVLEEDGRVVGHAGIDSPVPGVLSLGMAVLPEWRGRGGGRMLLEAIFEHARDTGAHKVELEVWPDNARAIALYAATGFEVEGVRRERYRRRDGSLRSAILMARRVDR